MTEEQRQSQTAQEQPEVPTQTIIVPSEVPMVTLLGPRDEILRTIERAFPQIDIHVRGNEFHLSGSSAEIALVERLVDELLVVIATGQPLNGDAVERSVRMLREQTKERPADVLTMNIVSNRGRTIRPKTLNQKHYVDAIDKHTIVFGIGPAGTGKTYLAMAKAVAALQAKQVSRIILTRPAVEAGERLGFLPGTLSDKIDPYLRPLYDALHDMIDPDSIPRLMAAGTIEVAPLAYMRGRTLNDAFIILDEAQNTSPEQMKMFLTRLGFGSKIVVTGDVTQVDLPGGTLSGLRVVQDILDGVEDVHFAELTSQDVVRHRLVGAIVDAYGRWDQQNHPGAVGAAAGVDRGGRQRLAAKAVRTAREHRGS
jgi:phosphate starvation-inducible PhoH-like protein